MSYIIEQTIRGKIYLYKVDSYWDKDKKQARQKRTYLGPKDAVKKKNVKAIYSNIVHKNYGNIFLLNGIVDHLGLKDICSRCFPDHYQELLALAYYEIMEGSALYLFPYWLEESYLPGVRKMDSPAISRFCDEIGRAQGQRLDFQEQWISHLQPIDALFYDITSISSYSSIDFVEWGYNRDQEHLAQVNMGVAFCNKRCLPVFYAVYPGSIVDVNTLTNCVKFLQGLGLKAFMFVLDRGFFSTGNITGLSENPYKITFIQPLPFSLKKAKELVKANRKVLHDVGNSFTFNNELLSHVKSEIRLNDKVYPAHVFLNEKAELEQRQVLVKKLIEIEEKVIKNKTFTSQKEALAFKENNIGKACQEYFKFDRLSGKLKRDTGYLKAKVSQLGFFILMTNDEGLERETILSRYRDRDQVEKVFDLLKNEMDGGRLRAHSQYNTDARLFVKFLALIIQSEIMIRMRKADMFKKYTVRELLAELKKIKHSNINGEIIISEVSKKQRQIYEDLNVDLDGLHRY